MVRIMTAHKSFDNSLSTVKIENSGAGRLLTYAPLTDSGAVESFVEVDAFFPFPLLLNVISWVAISLPLRSLPKTSNPDHWFPSS
jgi:hypothetical protein